MKVKGLVEAREVSKKAVVLLLDNPPLNIITEAMCEELLEFLQRPETFSKYIGIILMGKGEHFSAGADIDEHLDPKVRTMLPKFLELLYTLATFPLDTVAGITGLCLGGGLELARACRQVICWNAKTLQIGVPEIKLACYPPFGLTVFPKLADSADLALRFLLTGQVLKGEKEEDVRTAFRLRLLDKGQPDITDPEEFIEEVDFYPHLPQIEDRFRGRRDIPEETLDALIREEQRSHPIRAHALKTAGEVLIKCAHLTDIHEALQIAETVYLQEIVPDANYQECLMAFKQKRPPVLQK